MTDRDLLRHLLAVLAYRGGKPLRNAKPEFAGFDSGGGQTPLKILAHLGDLMDWALTQAQGKPRWVEAPLATWNEQVPRFFASLAVLDQYLASDAPIQCDLGRLLAGPIADALTHVGQLMMLRRISGDPVYGENYFVADIVVGRVGFDQTSPVKIF